MIISESETCKMPLVVLGSNGFVSPATHEQAPFPHTARLLLAFIHGKMPKDGEPLILSREEISGMIGVSPPRLAAWFNMLEEHWLIETDMVCKPGTDIPVRAVVWVNPNVDLTND